MPVLMLVVVLMDGMTDGLSVIDGTTEVAVRLAGKDVGDVGGVECVGDGERFGDVGHFGHVPKMWEMSVMWRRWRLWRYLLCVALLFGVFLRVSGGRRKEVRERDNGSRREYCAFFFVYLVGFALPVVASVRNAPPFLFSSLCAPCVCCWSPL